MVCGECYANGRKSSTGDTGCATGQRPPLPSTLAAAAWRLPLTSRGRQAAADAHRIGRRDQNRPSRDIGDNTGSAFQVRCHDNYNSRTSPRKQARHASAAVDGVLGRGKQARHKRRSGEGF